MSQGKHHDIKIHPQHFELVIAGLKPFEIRFNDREYRAGDTVTLHEWDPDTHEYTGRTDGPLRIGCVYSLGGCPNQVVFSTIPLLTPAGEAHP